MSFDEEKFLKNILPFFPLIFFAFCLFVCKGKENM